MGHKNKHIYISIYKFKHFFHVFGSNLQFKCSEYWYWSHKSLCTFCKINYLYLMCGLLYSVLMRLAPTIAHLSTECVTFIESNVNQASAGTGRREIVSTYEWAVWFRWLPGGFVCLYCTFSYQSRTVIRYQTRKHIDRHIRYLISMSIFGAP